MNTMNTMNTIGRILGEATKVRPPTEDELTGPYQAYWYAVRVLKGRFREGEPALATDPRAAYNYSMHINGPFSEGEPAIATDPQWASLYAKWVLNRRFPEAEVAIATDPEWAKEYLKAFPEAKLEWIMNGWLDWLDS
jgi:hypothetical protein